MLTPSPVLSLSSPDSKVSIQIIYEKVKQLKMEQDYAKAMKKQKQYFHEEQCVKEINIGLHINRNQQIIQQRAKMRANTTKPPIKRGKIKSQLPTTSYQKHFRLINFLQNNKDEKKIIPQIMFQKKTNLLEQEMQQQRQFTPLRAHSRLELNNIERRTTQTSSLRRTVSRQSSFRITKNPTKSPVKYLRKGARVKQMLLRQIHCVDPKEEQDLAYLKNYDIWVPSSLAKFKRQELEHYLQILMGNKKNQDKRDLKENGKFQMIYL